MQIIGNVPFPVSAASASDGAVSYTVLSGPAVISGNILTLTGTAGTVMLRADQSATANYAAATATTSFNVVTAGAVAGTSFTGHVQVAGLPVIGASVQLYDAGTSGNGSSPNVRLGASLTTDANGNFTVPSSYSCIAADTPLFLLAQGGKVGSAGNINSALWLITALPPCGSITSSWNVAVNELTTVAAAEALAQFYAGGGSIGASATNTAGLDNAIVHRAAFGEYLHRRLARRKCSAQC